MNTIEEIELNIEQAREFITKAEKLDQLMEHPLFQELVLDGYCRDEAVRLVHLKGDPNMQDEKRQAAIIKDIDGIGSLKGFFSKVYQQAGMAENAIAADEEALEELRAEEAE